MAGTGRSSSTSHQHDQTADTGNFTPSRDKLWRELTVENGNLTLDDNTEPLSTPRKKHSGEGLTMYTLSMWFRCTCHEDGVSIKSGMAVNHFDFIVITTACGSKACSSKKQYSMSILPIITVFKR
jgi:hypothetical protein